LLPPSMRKKTRFTFIVDRSNRTAFATLVASLEGICEDPFLRLIRPEEFAALDLGSSPDLIDIVGFSTMTATFDACVGLLRRLKMHKHGPNLVTMCGGSHATGRPLEVLKSGFDYCCVGEGEEVLRRLVVNLQSYGKVGEVPGLLRLRDGKLDGSSRSPCVEIDSLPALPLRRKFPTYIEIGRGCRWACAYCQTPRIHGRIERFRSARSVEMVIAKYKEFGMRDFRLLLPNALGYCSTETRVTNCDAIEDLLARACKAADGGQVYLGSFPSEVRPDYVTPEAIAVLRRYVANRRLVIGGQAASHRILKDIQRNHTVEDIRTACEIVQGYGFRATVDLMFGFPDEDAQAREETFAFMDELGRKGIVFNMHFFMPLPGTPLAASSPSFLTPEDRRRLDRLASGGIVRGGWRRQEEIARQWVLGRQDKSQCP